MATGFGKMRERERERESRRKREMMKIKELYNGVVSVQCPVALDSLSLCHVF